MTETTTVKSGGCSGDAGGLVEALEDGGGDGNSGDERISDNGIRNSLISKSGISDSDSGISDSGISDSGNRIRDRGVHDALAASAAAPTKKFYRSAAAAVAELGDDDESDGSDSTQRRIEADRYRADIRAAHARLRMQEQVSRHAQVFEIGDAVFLHPDSEQREKLNLKGFPVIVFEKSPSSTWYRVAAVLKDRLRVIKDRILPEQLSPKPDPTRASDALLSNLQKQVRDGTFQPRAITGMTFQNFSRSIGNRALGCACGKNTGGNGPVTCSARCRCAINSMLCGSSCHPGRTCNRKTAYSAAASSDSEHSEQSEEY